MGVAVLESDRVDRVVVVVVGITVLALAARFVLLGDRVAHWDEARVAFWILDYAETGEFEYRPIIHGPFYHHVTPLLFEAFGRTDATMRIAPAAVGGLLPLTALLFRARLRGIEVMGVAFFLAANPLLLYYSRFMRGDPLVAAFMFTAFAFAVRAIDADRGSHVVAAAFFVALGFTAKENALVYLLCWLGGLALLLYLRLYTARYRDVDWLRDVTDAGRHVRNGLVRHAPAVGAGVVVFLVVIVFFYAPRSADPGATALGNVASNPLLLPAVLEEATVGSWRAFYGTWVGGNHQDHAYLPYLADLVTTLGFGAIAVVSLAVVGFVVESITTDRARPVVLLAFFWGFASLLGYPIITDIRAPWAGVHVVTPFVIPAAAGLGRIIGLGLDALDARDTVGIGLALVVLVLISVPIGAGSAQYVYVDPSSPDNELVQYAQPAHDFHPAFHEMERIAAANDGTDVLLYGNGPHPFVEGSTDIRQYPSCAGSSGWYNALPVPWYLHRSGANVTCIDGEIELDEYQGRPPVVIALQERPARSGGPEWVTPSELDSRFDGYDTYTGKLRTTDLYTVVYVDRSRLPNATATDPGPRSARSADPGGRDVGRTAFRDGPGADAGAPASSSRPVGARTSRPVGARTSRPVAAWIDAVAASRDVYPGVA